MKKLLLVSLIALSSSVAVAKPIVNTKAVELVKDFKCLTAGCTLMCKAPNGKAYVRQTKIDSAKFVSLNSGTVIYRLKKFGEDVEVVIPSGTESCEMRNVRS
ncbi:TPA: hypothetical protein JG825_003504 [Vibrio parahaemolyticus]|uniref:hypothetical protein n=1 Tax=Vibrio TaxID=662 RepID=UPI0018F1E7CE|nr:MULTISPECIES: hypothetical protein [Vibrio]MCR9909715.1 hypothetical protein [Vibrio campbellii]MDK9773336.1 hypothetical protein [Vibrio sp. B181a]UPR19034.1 hypothetical protein H9J99_26160 [Vibrio parahaemolyticus]HAV1520185.1 hypothetical protein [Vibrio parahaemolyticus]HAV1539151.1 hypothetical protein [Vibrio parahaemolyticus]